MSTPKKFKPLRYGNIRIASSKTHLSLDAFLLAVSALACALADLPFWLQHWLIVALVLIAGFRCHQWRAYKPMRLICRKDTWQLVIDQSHYHQQNTADLRVIDRCYYWSRWLVVVKTNETGWGQWFGGHIPVFYDACTQDDFRRLKIITRYFLD